MYKAVVLFVLAALISCNTKMEVDANEKDAASSFEGLTKAIDHHAALAIANGNLNAVAVAIYKNGKTYHNYYGALEPGKGNRPNDNTLFEIASLSKTLVGSLAAKAVVEGKLSLDDDIRKYLDGDYPNLMYEDKPVTLRHLVTHTLGFDMPPRLTKVYRGVFKGEYVGKSISYTIDSLFEELKTVTLTHEPGSYYEYSNVGPELVAFALEKVYGKAYNELLQEFFVSLDIKTAHLYDESRSDNLLAVSFTEQNERAAAVKNPLLGGAGGIVTTLPDLTKYMTFQLSSNDPLIKESRQNLFEDKENRLGYFWELDEGSREGFYYKKSGSASGTETIMLLCPDSDYGIVMIMNKQTEDAMDDFATLYSRIEYDLLEYPKVNAWASIEDLIFTNKVAASEKFDVLEQDTSNFYIDARYLNDIGYEYIYKGKFKEAKQVFEFATSKFNDDANLHDSLGELYFFLEQYEASKKSYQKSVELNPGNENAKGYLSKIDSVLSL